MTSTRPTDVDRPLPILSWAMYDFANTIYSAIVVTAFFPHFLRALDPGRDLWTGLAETLSMVLAGVLVPAAGAVADRTGGNRRYLVWLTVVCCVATAAIGLAADERGCDAAHGVLASAGAVWTALLAFGVANFAYQASLVFYNAMLPSVASPGRQGRVSGLGVGLGYLGVVIALPIAQWLVVRTGTMRWAFVFAGAAFLLTALPAFLFVRPREPERPEQVTWGPRELQFVGLGATLRAIVRARPVLWFFLGNFLCVDVMNALIMWTRTYLQEAAGFSASGSIQVLMGMSATAFLLGMGMGWLTDKLGSKRTLLAASASLFACILAGGFLRDKAALVAVLLVLGSGGLGGVWVAGRKFLLEVAPAGKVTEYFGFYGLTTKVSVFTCTLFAALADCAGYRPALLSLLVPLGIGILLLAFSRAEEHGSV